MQRLAVICFSLMAVLPVHADEDADIQARIFNTYLEQANAGDSNSQFIVASRYESGKGTTRDMEKAYFWYEKAAQKGHPLAARKIEERQAAAAPVVVAALDRPTVAPAHVPKESRPVVRERKVELPVARPKEPVARAAPERAAAVAAPAVAPRQPEPVVVAKAEVAAPAPTPSINAMQALLGGKWSRQQRAAEYLPSPRTACLQSNANEVVCFSEEVTRNVSGNGMTYTVKATLSGLNNREGRFNLQYVYNVVDVNGKPFTKTNSALEDAGDMALRTGWQEPGIQMECRMNDERSVSCTRTDRKGSYQYVRD